MLPTNLQYGMPPFSALALLSSMREPNTASTCSPTRVNGSSNSGRHSGAYWPSPWTMATAS